MTKLGEMIALAAEAHKDQVDKQGKPYILHCLEVMRLLNSDDEELNCIAVGHDLLEDTEVRKEELELSFGSRVADIIGLLTRYPHETYEVYKSWIVRSPDAIRVKMADLTHNMDIRRLKGLRQKDFERTQRYMEFYTELKEALDKMTKV